MSFSTIFLLIFGAIGLGIAAVGARSVISARASSTWPHVTGEVTDSEISSDGDGGYSPLVRYSYSVSGQLFTRERICFGVERMFAGYKFAQTYPERYRVGSPVAVYYDPNQPSASVLESGISKRTFIPMAFGIGFVIFGGWFALLLWLFQR
jgi:hypothetical protein